MLDIFRESGYPIECLHLWFICNGCGRNGHDKATCFQSGISASYSLTHFIGCLFSTVAHLLTFDEFTLRKDLPTVSALLFSHFSVSTPPAL